MKRVGILTATRWELRAVRRAISTEWRSLTALRGLSGRWGSCDVTLIQTGVGMAKAREACRAMLNEQPVDLVLSSGFACALSASGIGDLLIGTDIITVAQQEPAGRVSAVALPCAAGVVNVAMKTAHSVGLTAHAGRFVTVPRVLCHADEKRRIAAETDAIGLDMESSAVGAIALERGVPFAVIRAVSDLLDEDLPVDFNLFLQPADWPRGTLACLARPSSLIGLSRLRSHTAIASERLTTFLGRFLGDLYD